MTAMKPGDRVRVVSGGHAGALGEVLDRSAMPPQFVRHLPEGNIELRLDGGPAQVSIPRDRVVPEVPS